MKQINTQAIVLRRTDYGEADRILTLLTPDQGKLSLMAKGVRRLRSKLAGGIELFSVSEISFIRGSGEVGRLISARLITHYGRIAHDVNRTMLGYELIKQLHKTTEDEPETEYFELLEQSFVALDNPAVSTELIRVWFLMQLLRLGGHTPNLRSDIGGARLEAGGRYDFSFDDVAFVARPDGRFGAEDIKFLRVGFSGNTAPVMAKIVGHGDLIDSAAPLVATLSRTYLRT